MSPSTSIADASCPLRAAPGQSCFSGEQLEGLFPRHFSHSPFLMSPRALPVHLGETASLASLGQMEQPYVSLQREGRGSECSMVNPLSCLWLVYSYLMFSVPK